MKQEVLINLRILYKKSFFISLQKNFIFDKTITFKSAIIVKQYISTPNAPLAIDSYSQAVLANGILYISGQIPINPETNEVISGIAEETHQVMKNLKAILDDAKMNFSHVVKTNIFLKNMEDFTIVNEIYTSYLSTEKYPARETIQVANLPKNVSVEISMIAHQD